MRISPSRDQLPIDPSVDEQRNALSFKPHITERLSLLEHPKTSLDHEVLHTARDSYEDYSSLAVRPITSQSLDYALWLEAGKHSHKSAYAKSLDVTPPINYNIWRNYRHFYAGVNNSSPRRTSTQSRLREEAAFKYPIVIPAPSRLGENHLRQFFEANRKELFRHQSHYRMALIRADNDERLIRLLSLKSQQRRPPLSTEDITGQRAAETPDALPKKKSPSPSSIRTRPALPQDPLSIIPRHPSPLRLHSGKKLRMQENHPSVEKLQFEQELKKTINFHRELQRTKQGNEKSLYARHAPV